VLTNLRRYQLGFDNLDALVMICKNWLNDAHANCPFTFTKKFMADYLYSKDALLDDHEKELKKFKCFENE
jgi:hypothetical protein